MEVQRGRWVKYGGRVREPLSEGMGWVGVATMGQGRDRAIHWGQPSAGPGMGETTEQGKAGWVWG